MEQPRPPANAADIATQIAEINAHNARVAEATAEQTPGAPEQPVPPSVVAPTAPTVLPTEIDLDGQKFSLDQLRQMRATATQIQQRESGLAERERVLAESRRQLDGIIADALKRQPSPSNPVATPIPSPVPAPTPLLDALEPLARDIADLKRRQALDDLHTRYGQFDEQAVSQVANEHPSLPYEAAFHLVMGRQAAQAHAAATGAAAAQRLAEAARTEPGAGSGVVTTQPINPANVSWEQTRQIAIAEAARYMAAHPGSR